jgi:hypothetical protein
MPRPIPGPVSAPIGVITPTPPSTGTSSGPATKLKVVVADGTGNAITQAQVGNPVKVTVQAVDDNLKPVADYKGSVQLQIEDPKLLIPNDKFIQKPLSPLQALDQTPGSSPGPTGLVVNVTFARPGDLLIVATSTNPQGVSITGQTTVSVSPAVTNCYWLPIRSACRATVDSINGYFSTSGSVSYFDQIRSIYNGASSSATVSADVATLNFMTGLQFITGTNIQAGSSSDQSGVTVPPTSAGSLPTLSAAGSAQAAQNMLYGGTLVVSARYPLIGIGMDHTAQLGNLAFTLDAFVKEGLDIQNFKANTNTQVNSPPSHTTAQMVGYLVYNAINPASGSTGGFAGSVFLGGAYGYSYTSHSYARDYGISGVSNGLGQVSAGMVINGIVSIAVSRGFGPSQTYIDSIAHATTTVNNFKAWSIGITYQSPSPSGAK